jgi:hypothetical protein
VLVSCFIIAINRRMQAVPSTFAPDDSALRFPVQR